MRKFILLITFVIGNSIVFAQQDPQFSQYMLNKLFMNPAYAGIRDALCFSVIGRQQWAGFDGSPRSGVISGDLVLPEDWNAGLGVNMLYDQLGFERNTRFTIDYSYHLPVNHQRDILAIGVEAGILNKKLGPTGSESWVAITNWMNDPSIPTMINKYVGDFGCGVWYQSRDFYLGASTTHLQGGQVNGGTDQIPGYPDHDLIYQMAHHYFITGGATLNRNHNWEFQPSFLVKTDGTITSFDISCLAVLKEKFWMGAAYRVKDSFTPMIGFQKLADKKNRSPFFEGGLKVGFAYDYTLSDLGNYNSGTFEIYLNYCLPFEYADGGGLDDRIFN